MNEVILTIGGEQIECTPCDLSDIGKKSDGFYEGSETYSASIAREKKVHMQLYKMTLSKAFFRDDKGNRLIVESDCVKELCGQVKTGYKNGDWLDILFEY